MKTFFSRNYHFLIVFIFPIFLFIGPILNDQVLFWGVSSTQFISWRSLALESLTLGQMPFWNPYNGMGTPLLANYQLAFFYPPNWIQFLYYLIWQTPGIALSYNLLVPVHMMWTAVGIIFFTRELKLSILAQGISAISFVLCGYLISRMSFFSIFWTISWLPWIMVFSTRIVHQYLSERLSLRKSWGEFLKLCLAIAMMLLAGHAQSAWYILVITGCWVAVLGLSNKGIKGFLVSSTTYIFAGFTASGLAAVQLIPTFEFLQQSQRVSSLDYEYVVRYSFWPWRLLTFLLPDFFGNPGNGTFWGYGNYWEDASYLGLIPLCFGLYAIFRSFIKSRMESSKRTAVFFFGTIALIAGLIALGNNTPFFSFFYRWVPTFNMFQAPSRWIILTIFSISILSGIGVDTWLGSGGNERKKFMFLPVISGGVILAGFFTKFFLPGLPTTMSDSIIRLGVIGLISAILIFLYRYFRNQNNEIYLSIAIIGLVGVDLISVGYILNPFTNHDLYKKTSFPSSAPIMDERVYLSSTDEYDIKFSRFFRTHDFRAIESWNHLRAVNLPNINILSKVSFVNNFDPMVTKSYQDVIAIIDKSNNKTLDRWMEHMNVGTIEEIDILSPSGIRIIEIADSRFFSSFLCQEPPMMKDFFQYDLTKGEMALPDSPVFINMKTEKVEAFNCVQTPTTQFLNFSGNFNSLNAKVHSEQENWLELSTIYFPGWKATLDGVPVDLMGVNGFFLGINIPPGVHDMRIEFFPNSFSLGLAVSSILLVIIFGVSIYFYVSGQQRDYENEE